MTTRRPVVLVPGTWAWDGEKEDWYSVTSPFVAYLVGLGFDPLDHERPFVWDTQLGGIGRGDDDLVGWRAAGLNLYAYIVPPRCPDQRVPPAETIVISHSHGRQVVLFAAAAGLLIDTWIDICGPVRKDMEPVAREARPNIRRIVHLHGGRRDRWQWYGTLFDGRFGVYREDPLADENISVSEADHGQLVRDPAFFHWTGGAISVDDASHRGTSSTWSGQ